MNYPHPNPRPADWEREFSIRRFFFLTLAYLFHSSLTFVNFVVRYFELCVSGGGYLICSFTAFNTRSGRIGRSLIRKPPNALAIALPIAGSTGPNAASPTPFAPYGPSGCGVSTITERNSTG